VVERSSNRLRGAHLAGNRGAERNQYQQQQQLLHDDLLGGLVAALYRRRRELVRTNDLPWGAV